LKKRTKKLLSVCARLSKEGRAQFMKVFLILFLQKKKILSFGLEPTAACIFLVRPACRCGRNR